MDALPLHTCVRYDSIFEGKPVIARQFGTHLRSRSADLVRLWRELCAHALFFLRGQDGHSSILWLTRMFCEHKKNHAMQFSGYVQGIKYPVLACEEDYTFVCSIEETGFMGSGRISCFARITTRAAKSATFTGIKRQA